MPAFLPAPALPGRGITISCSELSALTLQRKAANSFNPSAERSSPHNLLYSSVPQTIRRISATSSCVDLSHNCRASGHRLRIFPNKPSSQACCSTRGRCGTPSNSAMLLLTRSLVQQLTISRFCAVDGDCAPQRIGRCSRNWLDWKNDGPHHNRRRTY